MDQFHILRLFYKLVCQNQNSDWRASYPVSFVRILIALRISLAEDLTVSDLACICGLLDRVDDFFLPFFGRDNNLEFDLWLKEKVNLGSATISLYPRCTPHPMI